MNRHPRGSTSERFQDSSTQAMTEEKALDPVDTQQISSPSSTQEVLLLPSPITEQSALRKIDFITDINSSQNSNSAIILHQDAEMATNKVYELQSLCDDLVVSEHGFALESIDLDLNINILKEGGDTRQLRDLLKAFGLTWTIDSPT
ncbi:hypothetical protein J6590_052524 [Homalodisca vitripennis]|nr:hypothetical protein J6590_052524 [Homalodisca vitripennis]